MHFFACCALLLVVVTLPTCFVQAGPIKDQCMAAAGITAQDVANRHETDDPGHSVKCFFRCFLENIGIIADNQIIPGAFDRVLGHIVTAEAVERMEATCNMIKSETTHDESCEFAWQISECYEGVRLSDVKKGQRTRNHRG
uniref:Odorant-binding protein 56i n=1 Tax=Drosophila melanogaster TaxID=7227 RepID=A9QIC4_DROME|nr:odorant-binding protein 56i [Drosophila melanogaster]ABW78118.1 odorant-binding protein 56i [Drosophila melanogaster]ABW78133.1 odorant-binding protein 56i [Drosophila melanogaster]ABW78138.1 odorant-binding protein 56i [Drosophila melanogaster]ABW78161.1 odorant-binding protein 56i [Drosophila melanogaster]